MNLEEELKKIVQSELGVELSELNADTRLREDLGADSLDITEILYEIEDHFDLVIGDSEGFEQINTIGELVQFVQKLSPEK